MIASEFKYNQIVQKLVLLVFLIEILILPPLELLLDIKALLNFIH